MIIQLLYTHLPRIRINRITFMILAIIHASVTAQFCRLY